MNGPTARWAMSPPGAAGPPGRLRLPPPLQAPSAQPYAIRTCLGRSLVVHLIWGEGQPRNRGLFENDVHVHVFFVLHIVKP